MENILQNFTHIKNIDFWKRSVRRFLLSVHSQGKNFSILITKLDPCSPISVVLEKTEKASVSVVGIHLVSASSLNAIILSWGWKSKFIKFKLLSNIHLGSFRRSLVSFVVFVCSRAANINYSASISARNNLRCDDSVATGPYESVLFFKFI